ncbi:hypothetical protein [Enterocloster sp.]
MKNNRSGMENLYFCENETDFSLIHGGAFVKQKNIKKGLAIFGKL